MTPYPRFPGATQKKCGLTPAAPGSVSKTGPKVNLNAVSSSSKTKDPVRLYPRRVFYSKWK